MGCVRVFLPGIAGLVSADDESGLFVVCVTYRVTTHHGAVIKRIKHKGLRRFHADGDVAGIHNSHIPRLAAILALLEHSTGPVDLQARTLRLHELKGRRRGTWSIRVSGNWRLTFRFDGTDVTDVDYEDYH